jgi:hypothetical protein
MEYYEEYNAAPSRTIQSIYEDKLHTGKLPKDVAEDIEDILQDLSDEYERSFNLQYVIKKTNEYFVERHLEIHQEQVKALLDSGKVKEAENLTSEYKGLPFELSNELDLSNPNTLLKVKGLFSELSKPIMTYPGALGETMNDQLVRGAFVSFMASEKRGKSFWLLESAIRGAWQGAKVAFFQAGDMTEAQQFRRICSYLTKKPVLEKFVGEGFIPIMDCVKNQLDTCTKSERECSFSPYELGGDWEEKSFRKEVTYEDLLDAYNFREDYKPCRNCEDYKTKPWGVPWIKKIDVPRVVTEEESVKKLEEFFIKKKRQLKISTHLNDSLSVLEIKRILRRWETTEGFIPDIIIIDYADLLVPSRSMEFRHSQNQIWKELRALSQQQNCLLITATQADAKSYEEELLSLANFSEDKRKYAHVTAMYGLNQDKNGREKKLGVLRINEIVVREAAFDSKTTVTVLQSLNLGRPFIGSYY